MQSFNTVMYYKYFVMVYARRKCTGCIDRWDRSLFIDSKWDAAQAPHEGRERGAALCSVFSLQYTCDAGTDNRGFLYASFTSQTPQSSSFPWLLKPLYESPLSPCFFCYDSLPLSSSRWMMTAPVQIYFFYCCKAQGEASCIPQGSGFTTTGWTHFFYTSKWRFSLLRNAAPLATEDKKGRPSSLHSTTLDWKNLINFETILSAFVGTNAESRGPHITRGQWYIINQAQ